jgi:hypothetical protein
MQDVYYICSMSMPKWVYIEWCDAQVNSDGWKDINESLLWSQENDWIIQQVGIILNETKKYLLIAGKQNPQSDRECQYSEITKIPKTWIRKRKTLAIS